MFGGKRTFWILSWGTFLIIGSLGNEGLTQQKVEAGKIELKREGLSSQLPPAKAKKDPLGLKPLESTEPAPPSSPSKRQKIEIQPLEGGAETVAFQPKALTKGLAVELIVDGSGSMNGLLGATSKIHLVKGILEDLATGWATLKEPPLQFSLRVFGTTEGVEANDCRDSQLIIPSGPIETPLLKKILEKVEAKGSSPIAYALEKGGEDLMGQKDLDKVILLLTDGKDTCGQDPCQISKQLYRQAGIITHVVGFDISLSEEASIQCIAENAKGVYFRARNKEELASTLDEAIRSTTPYNLRLKVLVGGTPLPSTITLLKAGTQKKVRTEKSYGIELFRLDPGSYDILVSYDNSIAKNKPSKILKGVQLTETGKIEQEIRFELATVTLAAHNVEGKPAKTNYTFYPAGRQDKQIASFTSSGEETTLYLAPGKYDLIAERIDPGEEMTLADNNIEVSMEMAYIKSFAFQTGKVILKGETSKKQKVALTYKVTKAGDLQTMIKAGEVDKNGGKIELPPGKYDIAVEVHDPLLASHPRGKIENLGVEGGSIQEQTVTLAVGTLSISATKAGGEPAPSKFSVIDRSDNVVVAEIEGKKGKASLILSPGNYNITAMLISDVYEQGPTTEKEDITVTEDKETSVSLHYELGTLKILARNAKEQKLEVYFYVYQGATEEIVAQAGPLVGWIPFDLSPGNYDVKAVSTKTAGDVQPIVWQRNIDIEAQFLYVREMVFTNAKLRLIGRGTNNEIIPVRFKVYKYGQDRPFLSGITGQDWQSFDILPDQYYIEASYSDPETTQQLKKWISLKVEENEFVEKELRF